MPKIYTRTGDEGDTSLFGGARVPKSHPLIQSYGTVDELNALLGVARSHLEDEELAAFVGRLQSDLFVVGADLATPLDSKSVVPRVDAQRVTRLEEAIDEMQEELTPLKNFILPGGTPAAAALHHARTVCRRAERHTVWAAEDAEINEEVIVYLNRLSDLLFVLARLANARADESETVWQSDPSDG